ncbi:hypothetical protein [Oceanicella actignis]|uniref:Chromosome partition protein Smc n=1 Tax=Oceanicella actignis TaxID=1189325 RepID=A0A1M7SN30_9RHOB|nr:hypothetical protein [Oceanicella actignis]SES64152.1 hypothetical protein SAMN04488119_1013 [Oceanicella actignis]SHN59882.1 hypothetical protein SAMN05216200_1034 [Oceanicella actignis]
MAKKKPDEVTELRELNIRLQELEDRLPEARAQWIAATDRAQEARSMLGMSSGSRQMFNPDEQDGDPLKPYRDAAQVAQEEMGRISNEIDRVKARIAQIKRPALARERRDHLQETVQRLERQRDDAADRLNRLNERKGALEAALDEAERRVSTATLEARKAVLEGREIDAQDMNAAKAALENIRTELDLVEQAIAETEKERLRLSSSISSQAHDLRIADADLAGIELEELLRDHRDIVRRFTGSAMLLEDRIERIFKAVLAEGE